MDFLRSRQALGIHASRFILFAGTRLFPSIGEGERGAAQFLAFLEKFQVKGLKIIPSGEGRDILMTPPFTLSMKVYAIREES